MALNKFMHPRNLYCTPPNFKHLAQEYPEFGKYVIQDASGKAHIDFSDPAAVLCLTQTLLKRDFGLNVKIPPGHLIPTIPQRLNYILWIEDLLSLLQTFTDDRSIVGIDIGTGPSCIYPLLGAKKNGWKFLATEVDQEMVQWAKENVHSNNLDDKIEIVNVKNTVLEDLLLTREEPFDFCLCNPPFFCNHHEADSNVARTPHRPPPKAKIPATKDEKIVEGGEVEFVKKIIQESLKLKEKVRLYTTMLGKKKSLAAIKKELKKLDCVQFVTTEFCQGRTMRWGVAWTFLKNVDFTQAPVIKSLKPKPPLLFVIPKNIDGVEYKIDSMLDKIKEILEEVKITYKVTHLSINTSHMWIQSVNNTWSHQRRKRRELLRKQKEETHMIEDTGQANTEHLKTSDTSISSNTSPTTKCVNDKNVTIENNLPEVEQVQDISSEENISHQSVISSPYKDSKDKNGILESIAEENKKRKGEDIDISSKQQKLFENMQNCCEETDKNNPDHNYNFNQSVCKPYLLFCDVNLKKIGSRIMLKMQCKQETSSREPMHQVLQLFKNRLK